MSNEKLAPIHPGEVLLEEFLKPMALSQNRLAIDIGVPARRINEIVLGKRRVSADTALRLGRYFEMSPQFWLGLQMDYDLDIEEDKLGRDWNEKSGRIQWQQSDGVEKRHHAPSGSEIFWFETVCLTKLGVK